MNRYHAIIILFLIYPQTILATQYSDIYIFGDSLSDTGRVYQAVQLPPSPPYYQGRFSDGPVWVEYLTPQVGLTFKPEINFAWGGAHTDDTNNLDVSHPNQTLGLAEQIENYIKNTESADKQGLYVVWAGANDFNFLSAIAVAEIKTTVDNLIDAVYKLHEHGAQHFLIPNIPDVGDAPFVVAAGLERRTIVSAVIQTLNRYLKARLKLLPFPVMYFDSFTAMKNPEPYGVQVKTLSCLDETVTPPIPCTNPEHYYFWDAIHPATVTHRKIGDEMAQFLQQNPSPVSKPCQTEECHYRELLTETGFYNVILQKYPEAKAGMVGLSIYLMNDSQPLEGFHTGTVLVEQGQLPSFIAFTLSQDEPNGIEIYLYDYLKRVRQLKVSIYRNGDTRLLVDQQTIHLVNPYFKSDGLPAGDYVVSLETLADDPRTYFGMSILASSISRQINMGGILDEAMGETFIAFYSDPGELIISPYFSTAYGNSGAEQPKVTLRTLQGETMKIVSEF